MQRAAVWFANGLELLKTEAPMARAIEQDQLGGPERAHNTRRNIASIRDNVPTVIDGILKGDILGTFDQWCADDVVMSPIGRSPCF